MANVEEVHQWDIGTRILFTITEDDEPIDISTCVRKKAAFKLRDGTIFTGDLSFLTDGSDGQVYYITISGDLSVVGKCYGQAFIDMPTGEWYTEKTSFEVKDILVRF
jgi:hypothetical protein